MPRKTAIELAEAIAGKPVDAHAYIGKLVYPRKGSKLKKPGVVRNVTYGLYGDDREEPRLHVRWSDGRRTYPHAKGVGTRPDGSLEIL